LKEKTGKAQTLDVALAAEPEERQKLKRIEEMAAAAVEAIEEKKGGDIEVLKVTSRTTLADVFVLASGTTGIHVKSLADSVEEKLEETFGLKPDHIEGLDTRSWVLLDYGDLVVHILMPEDRAHYKLESLWRVDADKRPV
jgi:ribosome-associated protein